MSLWYIVVWSDASVSEDSSSWVTWVANQVCWYMWWYAGDWCDFEWLGMTCDGLIVWVAGGLCNSECCSLAVQTLVYLGRSVKQWSSLNSVLPPRETYHWKNVMYVYDILCTDSDMKACTDSCDVWVARHDSLGKDDYARILRYLLIYGCTLFDIHTTLQQNRQNWTVSFLFLSLY